MTSSVAVGIDLGGTTLSAVVIDRDGRVQARRTTCADVDRGPEAVITDIEALVDAVLQDASFDRHALIGVGIGTPGPLSHQTGRIIRAANLPGWANVPIRDRLREKLDVPVLLENDGNAAAFGEFRMGAGKDGGDLVMFTLGTGVGGGVVLGGRVLRGHFENAAELGHMVVVPDGLPCSCGQRGCLEQYASANGVARRVATALKDDESESFLEDETGSAGIDSKAVVRRAEAGDALCLRIWDEACFYLAVACVNIQHAFNPDRIVLGGGMSEAGSFLLDRVTRHRENLRWSLYEDQPAIVLAELGRDAGAMGAARLALMSFSTTGSG